MRHSRFFSSALLLAALLSPLFLSGCKRSESHYDDRTLEKRSHVETVAPSDKSDAFRP